MQETTTLVYDSSEPKVVVFLFEKCFMRMFMEEEMINFEEELKKFYPSLEVEDVEKAIYNQDLTDMADLLVGFVKEANEQKKEEEE